MFLGALFGSNFLVQSPFMGHTFAYDGEVYANWDGQWYKEVSQAGYSYRPGTHSAVAFFPAYPLVGRWVAGLTGLRHDVALLLASNVFLACTFCTMAAYLGVRPTPTPRSLVGHVLLSMGLVPTTFFFRMAYSESMFLLITTTVLYGVARGWPLPTLAGVVGLATATRPVGVGLIPPLLLLAWRRSSGVPAFLARASYLIPLSCWGIAAYIAYQQVEFGEPLAFAKTQESWRIRPPSTPLERLTSLATLEPLRSLYDPSSPAYWKTLTLDRNPIFSLRAADPVYFLGAVALVALGGYKRWITDYEVLAAGALLLVPYATIGYEQYMQSMGRYASAAVPIYIVLGHIVYRLRPASRAALVGIGGFFLGAYSAMFSAWYMFL